MKTHTLSNIGVIAPRKGSPLVAPTRRPVKHTGRTFRAKYYSLKNAKLIECESLLEMRVARLLEFASGITQYSEQPPALRIRLNGRLRKYTPDFLVHWRNGARWLIEVKPSEIASTAEMKARFLATTESAQRMGFHFRVLTERHVQKAGASGIEELLAIRRISRTLSLGLGTQEDPEHCSATTLPPDLITALSRHRTVSLNHVADLLGGGPSAIHEAKRLIADGTLSWDITQPLTSSTQVFMSKESQDEELFS